jgi:PrtD family type I secretion system ABC transporter
MTSRELKQFFRRARWGFAAVGFFSFVVSLLMLVMPVYLMTVIDRVLTSRSEETLLALTGIALFLLIILGFVVAMRSRTLAGIGQEFEATVAQPVFEGMIYRNAASPEGAGIVGSLDSVRQFLSGQAIASFFEVPFVPLFLLIIFMLHPLLGIIALVGLVFTSIVSLITDRLSKSKFAEAQKYDGKAQAQGESFARQADTLKSHGMIRSAFERWEASRRDAESYQRPARDLLGDSQGIMRTAMFFFPVLLLCTAGFLALEGEISAGAMIAGNILMMRTIGPVQQALGAWSSFTTARQSLQKLDKFLGEYDQYTNVIQETLPEPTGQILVEKAISRPAFQGGEPVLKGLNFKLEPGMSLGIIGQSGSGKSTLLRLVMGLVPPLKGDVKLDGVPAWKWSPEVLGRSIGYMAQDTELFEGTVAENIARYDTVDRDQVIAAAEFAGVHDRIKSLPNGYDTVISPTRVNLSGGEKQAVALARAVYGEPRVVVLDEPTASMDQRGQNAVKACLERLKQSQATVIVTSHQSDMLKGMDRLLFLQDGRLVGFGAPDEVVPMLQKHGKK